MKNRAYMYSQFENATGPRHFTNILLESSRVLLFENFLSWLRPDSQALAWSLRCCLEWCFRAPLLP